MRNLTETNATEATLSLVQSPDPRVQQIMTSLIKHLHAFVRDVELTEAEWLTGIRFLTAVGQKSDDQRQEFILLSDVLGTSILVDAISHRKIAGGTESTVFGPFWVTGAPELATGASIARGPEAEVGELTVVHGRVVDPNGKAISGAMLDVWQASPNGLYDVQDSTQPDMNLRGIFRAEADGGFYFKTVKPAAYPIPVDGPVGDLLKATGRHPMRPAHIHFLVGATGYQTLITHIFVEGDPYLESDAVLGVKDSLVVDFKVNESLADARRFEVVSPFTDVEFNFVLEPVP